MNKVHIVSIRLFLLLGVEVTKLRIRATRADQAYYYHIYYDMI